MDDERWYVLGDDAGLDGVPYIEVVSGDLGEPNFKPICHVQSTYNVSADAFSLTDDDRARAHLIAAAPELVALVKDYSGFVAHEIEKALKDGDAERASVLGIAQFNINAILLKAGGTPAPLAKAQGAQS